MLSFYTNVEQTGGQILIREVKDGRRTMSRLNYQPTLFVINNTTGYSPENKYTTLDGQKLISVKPGNLWDTRNFVKENKGIENFKIYGNIKYEYAYIHEQYPRDMEYDSSLINIVMIDIEVAKGPKGFALPSNPVGEVTAITIRRYDKFTVFGCQPYTPKQKNVEYIQCENEKVLLLSFLKFWCSDYPDIVSGWNIDGYDIPYIYNRIKLLFGENQANKLSPWGVVQQRIVEMFGKPNEMYTIKGVAQYDLLRLFRKFSPRASQESYSLDYISSVVLGEKKIDYSEYGNLDRLYEKNYELFIDYNIKDVDLCVRIDDKEKLIDLGLNLAYTARVNYEDIFFQVRMWDNLIYNHLSYQNIILPPKNSGGYFDVPYEGAFVKPPITGKHKWVISYDLTSEYPKLIIQYNISPETLVQEDSEYPTEIMLWLNDNHITVEKLLDQSIDTSILKKYDFALAANGHLFRRDKKGFLNEMMETMFAERKMYKDKAIELQKKNDPKLENLITKFDNLQQAKKVCLNSCYGALGNEYSRVYDVRLASAITLSGQLSVRWVQKHINTELNNMFKTYNKDYILASDTDSMYICLDTLIQKIFPIQTDTQKIVNFIDKLCKEKLDLLIQDIYKKLADYTNAYTNAMEMKREIIADSAIFVAKKRYMLNIWDKEGVRYEKPKIKITGLEAIRTTTPSSCRNKLKEIAPIILGGNEADVQKFVKKYKEDFTKLSLDEIVPHRGVSGIRKWQDSEELYGKGTPIHSKAAIIYNQYLEKYNVEGRYDKIQEGDKIKFLYLKEPNPVNDKVIAFVNVFPEEFGLNDYIDYDMLFQKGFIDPLNIILKVMNWKAKEELTLMGLFQ